MNKISILGVAGFMIAISVANLTASMAYRTAPTGRPAITGPANQRNTVPVTTTTTINVSVPATDITTETSETINIQITGARVACLGNPGNVWGDRMFASNQGVPTTSLISESDIAENNVCFSAVSMRSADIPNLAMIAGPRFFQTGTFVECGSWVPTDTLNEAILDANKNQRLAATIVASIGGATAGFFLTDLIANKLLSLTSNRSDVVTNAEFRQQLQSLKDQNPTQWVAYYDAVTELAAPNACGAQGNERNTSCLFADGNVHVSQIYAAISSIGR